MATIASARILKSLVLNFLFSMPKKQKFPHLVGSKWTTHKKIDGWRHFQVVNRKNQSKWVYAEMVAACDPNVRFWLNAKLLQDNSQWQAGWQSLQEIAGISEN